LISRDAPWDQDETNKFRLSLEKINNNYQKLKDLEKKREIKSPKTNSRLALTTGLTIN